ncbi:protein amnionless [Rhopalosiphum maidis]|uniref:protein amnionless n=1 Tax=Rhopalosiphum maidis TaxID=43146 RepID=UPI000EFE4BFE|nr:protein amnionless [Rhopalosiphum maidis]
MPSTAIIVVAALMSFSGGAVHGGVAKRWTPDVDFEAPRNWDAGHVPSSVDVAVFQEDTLVPVVVPAAGVDVCEIVFPVNGQLILEPNARVVISASSQEMGGCMGQTVMFKRNAPMEWVDPDNWSNENINIATPHVERIPCVHDTVVFNPGHSFSVVVPDVPITIGSMKFGNQTFGQNELNEFLLSDIGDQELKSSSADNDVSITLTSTLCEDNTGCECGTQQLLDQVCKVASKRCVSKLGCISPVKPIGHCCWTCGAYFLINYNPNNFISEQFNEELKKDIAKLNSTFEEHQLSYYMSKLLNGKIQVVLASNTKYVDEINEIANTIHSLLTSYRGVTDVKMFNSGLSYDADGMTYGQIALTTCIVIFSCMLAIMFYYNKDWKSLLSGSRSSTGAVFVKFKNDTNDAVELIDEDVRLQRKTSFDNPTYGAVESMKKSQTFRKMHSYSDLSVSTTKSEAMDVEMKETCEQK